MEIVCVHYGTDTKGTTFTLGKTYTISPNHGEHQEHNISCKKHADNDDFRIDEKDLDICDFDGESWVRFVPKDALSEEDIFALKLAGNIDSIIHGMTP